MLTEWKAPTKLWYINNEYLGKSTILSSLTTPYNKNLKPRNDTVYLEKEPPLLLLVSK